MTSSPAGISDCPGADCTEDYPQGTVVTLIATPAAGSTFASWTGGADCTDGMVTMNGVRNCTATFNVIPPNTLAITVNGSGTVVSDVGGISCPGTCIAMFSPGTDVTLTPTPGMNSTFDGWTGDADCSDGMVTLSAAIGCTATFTQITHTLTVGTEGTGSGTVTSAPVGISCGMDCTEDYPQGTVVTLTATPANMNQTFDGWTEAGCTGGSVTMSAPQTCTATFTQITHMLTVNKPGGGSGTVNSIPAGIACGATCAASFDQNTMVTLSAIPAAGSTFAGFMGDAGCAGGSVTMSVARTCTATFDLITMNTLTITVVGNGTVTSSPGAVDCPDVTCSDMFADETVVTLTPTADAGWVFDSWSGGGCGASVTMDTNRMCTATFVVVQHTLTVNLLGTGGGTVTSVPAGINCGGDCTQDYDENTMVALSDAADAGSMFVSWGGACDAGGNVTMTADQTCTATFDVIPTPQHTLTVNLLGTGGGTVTSVPAGINCGGDCTQDYDENTMVALSDAADAGSMFVSWGGACDAGGNVTMTADQTCTATFDLGP